MRVCLLVALLVSCAPIAWAEDVTAAREHYRKGTAFFDMGNYAGAAQEYSLAFEAKDDPALLFNIAQAHRLAGNAVEALRAYKGFLRRVPQTKARPEVEARIRDLQDIVDRQQATQQRPPTGVMPDTARPATPNEPAVAPTPVPAAATPVAPTTTATTTTTEARPPTPLYKKWWLWTAVAGGAVAVGLGVGLGVGLSGDHFNASLGKVGPGALTVVLP